MINSYVNNDYLNFKSVTFTGPNLGIWPEAHSLIETKNACVTTFDIQHIFLLTDLQLGHQTAIHTIISSSFQQKKKKPHTHWTQKILELWCRSWQNTDITCFIGGPGSSVGIATDYGLDGPGSNHGGDENFRPSRPALGPTQPTVQWVLRISRG